MVLVAIRVLCEHVLCINSGHLLYTLLFLIFCRWLCVNIWYQGQKNLINWSTGAHFIGWAGFSWCFTFVETSTFTGENCHVLSEIVVLHLQTWIIDHPQSGMVYNFDHVCLSDDNFWKPWHRKFIFAHLVYLQRIRVKFIYEDYRVKVKVTGAKMVQNPHSRNVKLWLPVTPVL